MMCNDNAEQVVWQALQSLNRAAQPCLANPALRPVEESPGARRRVDTNDRNLVIDPDWFGVLGNEAPPPAEGIQEALMQPVGGNVVVPRYGKNRSVEAIEEVSCGAVLSGTRTHGEVAANGNEVRWIVVQLLHKRLHHRRVDEVEMQVGDVGYTTYGHREPFQYRPQQAGDEGKFCASDALQRISAA